SSTEWFVLRVVPKDQQKLVTLAASEPELKLPPLTISTSGAAQRFVEVEAAINRREVWFDHDRPFEADDPLGRVKPKTLGLVRPFFLGETLIGTLTVGRRLTQPPLTPTQVGVVHTFADFLAVEIVNARLMEEQVNKRLLSRE